MATIDFDKLGKVARGAITPGDLTLLVGKNNTGKSYVASLVWAISNISTFSERDEQIAPQWWDEFIAQSVDAKSANIEITLDRQLELVQCMKDLLTARGSHLLTETFAYDGFSATKLSINPTHNPQPFSVALSKFSISENDGSMELIRGTLSYPNRRAAMTMSYPPFSDATRRLGERLFYEAMGHSVWGEDWQRFRSAVYIPAARTGLMIAFRALVAQFLSTDDKQPSTTLPRPLSDFLQRLAFGRGRSGRHEMQSVASWAEKNILHGAVNATDDEIPSFSFKSDYHEVEIPIHATSSMITELAPFLLTLRDSSRTKGFIIFEEPEAHLHLSAQRDIARVIARLVKGGTQVLITTHSDTFVQQINNLIALDRHGRNSRIVADLGYDDEDTLSPDAVKTYEFAEDNGFSVVREVPLGPTGFVVESLNETILSLTKETLTLVDDNEY